MPTTNRSKYQSVDWSTYSKYYDGLARNSPPYKDLIRTFEDTLRGLSLPDEAQVADLGCGTGNFALATARVLPRAQISAYDNNDEMVAIMRAKAEAAGVSLVAQVADLRSRPKPDGSLDAVSCVHCLYVLGKEGAVEALTAVFAMLKPGGYLLAADIGRQLEPKKFATVGVQHMWSEYGLLGFLREGFLMRGVQKEAKRISQYQREGRFYMHTLAEFTDTLKAVGFEIVSARDDMYLGITDLVVARKPVR